MSGGLPYGADKGGNIILDPLFERIPDPGPDGMWDGIDDDYGDLRLQPGSPCIKAGDPDFVPAPGETDLDGHARVLCGRVDMGAYEFGIGDYDCDQAVDLVDFEAWEGCATGPGAVNSSAHFGAEYSGTIATTGSALLHPWLHSVAPAGAIILAPPGCEAFDFDGDGDVDLADFGRFMLIAAP
jgi:hypothetical protein